MRKLSHLFSAVAILLSDVMCAVVAFGYRDMLCGIEHSCYSAPASVAFLYAIPFGIGIAVCSLVAYILHKRSSYQMIRSQSPRSYNVPRLHRGLRAEKARR